jgi:hypothetical protein
MKIIFVSMIMALVVGCKYSNKVSVVDNWTTNDFTVICLSGVEYYMRAAGDKGYMAVKIDKDTQLPALCQ